MGARQTNGGLELGGEKTKSWVTKSYGRRF